MSREIKYFDKHGVSVTDSHLIVKNSPIVVGLNTFLLADITSVSCHKRYPNYVPLRIGLLLAISFGLSIGGVSGVIIGVLIAGGALYLQRQYKVTYRLMVHKGSRRFLALTTSDEVLMSEVVQAVNQALTERDELAVLKQHQGAPGAARR